MFDSARAFVITEIAFPDGWKIIPEQRIPAVIEVETVILKHSRVEKLPEAPIGQLKHEVILAVFVPNRDIALAEDRLDEAITELITKLDGHSQIDWVDAQKVVTPDGQYPGWEITLTVLTEVPEPTSTTEPKEQP